MFIILISPRIWLCGYEKEILFSLNFSIKISLISLHVEKLISIFFVHTLALKSIPESAKFLINTCTCGMPLFLSSWLLWSITFGWFIIVLVIISFAFLISDSYVTCTSKKLEALWE